MSKDNKLPWELVSEKHRYNLYSRGDERVPEDYKKFQDDKKLDYERRTKEAEERRHNRFLRMKEKENEPKFIKPKVKWLEYQKAIIVNQMKFIANYRRRMV